MKDAKVGTVALVCLLTASVLLVAACGRGDGGPVTTGPGDSGVVLTVEQALAAEPGQELSVQGLIFFIADTVILASAAMESYPPQPAGPTLTVKGLRPEALVGLSTTDDQSGMVSLTWSDYPVVVRGVVEDGVLEVTGTPRVVEMVEGDLRIRFSPVEPVRSDETAWWAFDVTNSGSRPVVLTFSNGQRGDVILTQGGVEMYRWSSGKAFTEAIETISIEPGSSLPVLLNDTMTAEPGDYDLTAVVTASAGGGGQVARLPALETTLTVY